MGQLTDWVTQGLQAVGWSDPSPFWAMVIAAVLGSVVMFTAVFATGGLFTFAFRRIFARMGQRMGPNRVGPQGIFQFLADGVKLIAKEDVRPSKVDGLTWRSALYVAAVPTALAWAPLPWSDKIIFADVATGVLFIFAISAIAPLGEILAGWGSNNKYSLYGGVRAAALDVSYEIPLIFAISSVLLMVGSLSTQDLVTAQAGMWFIIPQIIGFGIFFIAGLAKAGLVPTDLAESESELVSGFTTEYSGMRFGSFFVVIFSNVFFIGSLITMFYLGGWQPLFGLTFIPPILWFVGKALLMSFVIFWVWSTLPRVRVDSYLNMAWKVMLPISIFNFLLTAVLIKSGVLA